MPARPVAARLAAACLTTAMATACAAPELPTSSPAPTWAPAPGTAWQWQLTGPLDLSVDVPVYELDGQTTAAAQVDALHATGRRAICYVSVGSWEAFRPDAAAFPTDLLGAPLADYPDERWLDVRQVEALAPLLTARLDACRDKGFDAVEPDNVDGWANDSGFPLTAEDALGFIRWVAAQVHARGMSVALKNDLDQVPELVDDVDFAVVEQCARYDECERLRPFVAAGKAVLRVEYGDSAADCGTPWTGAPAMVKREQLDAFRVVCD